MSNLTTVLLHVTNLDGKKYQLSLRANVLKLSRKNFNIFITNRVISYNFSIKDNYPLINRSANTHAQMSLSGRPFIGKLGHVNR